MVVQQPCVSLELENGSELQVSVVERDFMVSSYESGGRMKAKGDVVHCGSDLGFRVRLGLPPNATITRVDGRPLYPSERETDVDVNKLRLDLVLTELDGEFNDEGVTSVRLRIDCSEEPALWMEVFIDVTI